MVIALGYTINYLVFVGPIEQRRGENRRYGTSMDNYGRVTRGVTIVIFTDPSVATLATSCSYGNVIGRNVRVLGSYLVGLLFVLTFGSFHGGVLGTIIVLFKGYVLDNGPRILLYIGDRIRTTSYGTSCELVHIVGSLGGSIDVDGVIS